MKKKLVDRGVGVKPKIVQNCRHPLWTTPKPFKTCISMLNEWFLQTCSYSYMASVIKSQPNYWNILIKIVEASKMLI